MASSISDNGGRSCVNASAVIVPKYAKEIAEALGKKIGPLKPLPVDDPNAVLSGLQTPRWVSGSTRPSKPTCKFKEPPMPPLPTDGPRLLKAEGGTYLRPTVVHCESIDHPCQTVSFFVLTQA